MSVKEKEQLEMLFQKLCSERLCNTVGVELQRNEDFHECTAEAENLYEQIAERLGEERKLINRFDAAKNSVAAAWDMPVYLQGMKDCALLLRYLGLIS